MIYEARLKSLADGNINAEYFNSFDKVIEHIRKDSEHVLIDLEKLIIKLIIIEENIKRIVTGTILLQLIETTKIKLNSEVLDKIIIDCNKNDELRHNQIKNILKNFAIGFKEILEHEGDGTNMEIIDRQIDRLQ